MRVFLDSDVVISSLLSNKGAAYLLINKQNKIELWISDFSVKELKIVVERLGIARQKLEQLMAEKLRIVKIKSLGKKFEGFVSDVDDAHIVAGAVAAKAGFLITYNRKHYEENKIRGDLKIILRTPAEFLQYLRTVKG